MDKQSQKGGGEVFFIIAVVAYFMFMGWLASALGYSSSSIGPVGSWSIPTIAPMSGSGWLDALSAIANVAIVLVNLVVWIVQALISFFVLLSFTVQGDIPGWVIAILFTPVGFGVAWAVFAQARGRE